MAYRCEIAGKRFSEAEQTVLNFNVITLIKRLNPAGWVFLFPHNVLQSFRVLPHDLDVLRRCYHRVDRTGGIEQYGFIIDV